MGNHGSGLPPGLVEETVAPERTASSGAPEATMAFFLNVLESWLLRLPRESRHVFLGKGALILSAASVILDIFYIH